MAQYPKVILTLISNPTLAGASIRLFIQSLEVKATTTLNNPPGYKEYLIGPSINETASNLFDSLITYHTYPFFVSQVAPTIIEIECRSYYLGNFSYLIANASDFDVEVVPVEQPDYTPFTYTLSFAESLNHSKCDFVRVNINQLNGEYPITIDYGIYQVGQQKIATNSSELWIELPRITDQFRPNTIFLTEEGGATLAKVVPFVSKLLPPTITFSQGSGTENQAIVNPASTGQQSSLDYLYSFDGTLYSGSNIFLNVPVGIHTFYVKDQFGCVVSVDYDIPQFQITEIYAVHNPLNFIIERSTADEFVECEVKVNFNSVGTFRAIPYNVENGINRYILFADEIIRASMPPFDDYPQPQGALIPVTNMAAEITITVVDSGALVAFFIAVNAARQVGGDGAKMLDLVNNAEQPFIFVAGQPGYVYFYDNKFLREKLLLTSDAEITRGDTTKKVEVLPFCTDDLIIKYLDRNGMYRFYKFNHNYKESIQPQKLGVIQTMFESLATAQGLTRNVGYKNTRELSATAYAVPSQHMTSLQDLFVSPRVHLHIGDLGLDARPNWVLVDVEAEGPVPVKLPKRKFNDLRVTIILPDEFNITLL